MKAGTAILRAAAFAAILAAAGCASDDITEIGYDGAHPMIKIDYDGRLTFMDEPITPKEAAKRLEAHGIPKDATIHILVDDRFDDARATWVFQHNYLGKAGYRRTILVHQRRMGLESKESARRTAKAREASARTSTRTSARTSTRTSTRKGKK